MYLYIHFFEYQYLTAKKRKSRKLDFKNPNLISELNGTTFVKKQKTSII